MTEIEIENPENSTGATTKVRKISKRGIIYLSNIPPYMNVTQIREFFGDYGTLGRVYLQLADKEPKPATKKRKFATKFTEGWIEFEHKSDAKRVAALLNNTQISNKKKSKYYDMIWNIKYLSNFKWVHLHERLAYEKATRRQKLRAEIQLAKKKTNYFTINLDKAKKNKKFVNKDLQNISNQKDDIFTQSKELGDKDISDRSNFLKSLFS